MRLPFRRALRPHRRRTTVTLVGALGATAILLAACGSSTTASASTAQTAPSSATRTPTAPPGVSGTIAAVAGQSMEVQNPRSGQTTVTYTTATAFTQTVPASSSAVVVGACVSAVAALPAGSPSSPTSSPPSSSSTAGPTPLVATTVLVEATSSGTCDRRAAAGLGGFRTGHRTGTPTTGSLPADHRRRPSGVGRFVVGQVAATTATSFTVTETNPRTGAHRTVTVDTTSSTSFSETEPAAPTDLAVGKCVRALGPASSTGAVAARSVAISSPGPNGCAGFGAGGFGAGRSASSGSGTSAGGSAGATA